MHVPIVRNKYIKPQYDPGTLTAIALGLTATSIGVGASQASKQRKAAKSAAHAADVQAGQARQAFQQDQATAAAQATARKRKRVSSATRTIYTSPLGIGGQADVAKKTLLGQ